MGVQSHAHTVETVSQLVAKMTKGVEAMEVLYRRESPDSERILELMQSTDDIPCAWTPGEIKALYHDYRYTRFDHQHADADDEFFATDH